tara:strand:- start:918 stop:1136 length:219 start_codon:yes stop_codon:yes gene_type:complete
MSESKEASGSTLDAVEVDGVTYVDAAQAQNIISVASDTIGKLEDAIICFCEGDGDEGITEAYDFITKKRKDD